MLAKGSTTEFFVEKSFLKLEKKPHFIMKGWRKKEGKIRPRIGRYGENSMKIERYGNNWRRTRREKRRYLPALANKKSHKKKLAETEN